jgi:microtubule-associated protein-like 6
VWGYNGLEARYGADGGVCYSAAALALSLKQGEGEGAATEQKICQGHDDDVQAFCMSNDRALMATGQMGKAPNVKIWDSESCLLLATLTSKELKRGVAALAFNEEGDKLVAVGQDDDHMLVVFEDTGGRWSTVEEKASGKGDKAKVLFASWDGEGVVAGGLKFIKFFSIDGKNIKSKKGVFGKDGKIQALPCCCVYKKGGGEGANAVVTGTADGNL